MEALSLLIKPSSANCNLGCKYCFYYDVAANREHKSFGFMDETTSEQLIKKAMSAVTKQVTFAFQGGEPTVIGLDYFKRFVELVNKYKTTQNVNYAIQTNGTLLTDEFCQFFHDNKFLVGLSLDGPKEIHDLNRLNQYRKGTFKEVDKAAKLLNKHKVDFNILTVVTKVTVRYTRKIYNYFKAQNYRYLQFIPCINDFNDPELKPYNITPDDYGKFLVELFDLWYNDLVSGYQVSIRMFDNYVQMMMGLPPESCDMNGFCSVNPVIEADGSVYPCDFYVLDQWKLGNINDQELPELMTSEKATSFLSTGHHYEDKCKTCQYAGLCRSGCRRHKEMFLDENGLTAGESYANYFCDSYIYFFDRCYPKLQHLTRMIQQSQGR